jgi:ADP-ribosylglycohydrolase
MISDDTEHSLFVAQSLLSYPDDATKFQKCLAWKLRLWLLGLPAGIGFATLRAILKLWLGFPAHRAGVYSAGNGPAMRSACLLLLAGSSAPQSCICCDDPGAWISQNRISLAQKEILKLQPSET